MREQVLIVLNERESQKRRAADLLSAALQERGITSSRLKVDDQIERRIVERRPQILVIDYLLGDSSTALDVIAQLRRAAIEDPARVFLFTDEPSAAVAVAALRLGAENFYALDNPASVQQLAEELALTTPHRTREAPPRTAAVEDLVASDPSMQRVLRQLVLATAAKVQPIIIGGSAGSGRTTLARTLLPAPQLRALHELDLRYCSETARQFVTRWNAIAAGVPTSSRILLLLDQADHSTMALIPELSRAMLSWCELEPAPIQPVVITNDSVATTAWEAALRQSAIVLPSLPERAADMAPLAQRFFRQACIEIGLKTRVLDATHIQLLSSLTWTRGLHSLRATLSAAAMLLSMREQPLSDALREGYELTTLDDRPLPNPDSDPHAAALALWESHGDPRIAAARLGCSVAALRERLSRGDQPL